MAQFLLRRVSRLALMLAFSVGLAHAAPQRSSAPPQRMPVLREASGQFLAGIVANTARDTEAAAEFFREALKADPRNAALLEQAFIADLMDGNLPEAFKLAERVAQRDRENTLAQVALGVRSLKLREFQRAWARFDRATGKARTPDLTIALLRAWTQVGVGKVDEALAILDKFNEGDVRSYRDFYAGLMAEVAKRPAEAEKFLASAYKSEKQTLRVAEALVRQLARRQKPDEAKVVAHEFLSTNPGHPIMERLLARISRGEAIEPLVTSAAEGAAEVFYGLGASGAAARDPMTALIYVQFAHFLSPADHLLTLTLAETFEQLRQSKRAVELYGLIPRESPLANRAFIGRATALERIEKNEEPITVLRQLLSDHPEDMEAADTLGMLLRIRKRWAESIDVYAAAIKAVPVIETKHWPLYFGRAIGYERTKQWEKAEADFKTALDLLPRTPRTPRQKAERAQVMNYLAYSWVDMGLHIDKSFEMLKEAVALTPDDGAIVDSLGWAYFRLGKYEDAVRELERAVLLRSGDPTINDHLGDAYWRIGRKREAYYKWSQALGLEPEAEERPKIEKKLENGLEDGPAAAVVTPKPNGG